MTTTETKRRPAEPAVSKDPPKASPVFVARFSDDQVTRMTVYSPGQYDLGRAIRLARTAYEVRTKQKAPPIIQARFVDRDAGDRLLRRYSTDELKEAQAVPRKPAEPSKAEQREFIEDIALVV